MLKVFSIKQSHNIFARKLFLIWAYFSLYSVSAQVYANTVVKAATLNFPPYEFIENDQAKGLAVDIIKHAFAKMNYHDIDFMFSSWGRSLHETKHGNRDVLFNTGIYQDRKEWGTYVDSVLIEQQYVFFALAETSFTINAKINNVENLTLGTRMHYGYGAGALRDALDNSHFKHVSEVNTHEQNIKMLLSKRIDVFVGDYLPVMHYLVQNCLMDKVRVIKQADQQTNFVALKWNTYMLVSNQSPLIDKVDTIGRILNEMKADGTFDALVKPYYEVLDKPKTCHYS